MTPYEQRMAAAIQAENADGNIAALANSIFTQESSKGKNTKTSNQGAMGAMQMLPSTFKGYADKGWSIDNPDHNLRAGIRYLKDLNRQFKGDLGATAAAYYGGPKAGKAYLKGESYRDLKNPGAPNTTEYANSVLSRVQQPSWEATPLQSAVPKEQAVPQEMQPMTVASSQPTPMPRFGEGLNTRLGELNAMLNAQNQAVMPQEYTKPVAAKSDYENPFWKNFRELTGIL